jgi:acyl-CoA dehydrogenase
MLERIYDQEHRIFRETFRRWAAERITPGVRDWEAQGSLPRDLWREMGGQGYLCPGLPPEHGGLGLGYEYSVIIGEELVRADAFGTGIPLHSDVIAPYLWHYGTEAVKAEWLPRAAAGQAVLAIGMTEPESGSDLSAIRTTAVRDGDQYVIDGQKTFITNGASADAVVLAVKTDPESEFFGTSLILVETDRPGFSAGRPLKKMGCHLMDTAELFLSDCRVPADNLLGREGMGAKMLLERLPEERLEIAVKCQAMAEEVLRETLAYVKTRKVFGRSVGNFQANAFKLSELATDVELGRNFLDRVVLDHIAGRDVSRRANMAKYWLSEMVNRAAAQALQLFGGYGYMDEYRISRMYRDVRVTTVYAGTNEIMKGLIARGLGLRPA